MKKRTIKRSILGALVVTIMLMAALLTACSSGQATETPAKEETTKAEVTEETAEVEQEEVATPEPTEKPTPEPEVEDSKYPGIDMESTLPGLEWIATFDEIDVDEPIIVVYNDDTNKKVIVNEGDEVEFSKSSDTIAFYTPNSETIQIAITPGGFNESWEGGNELPDSVNSTRRIACSKGVTLSESKLKCTLTAIINEKMKDYRFVLKFVD
jgi:hypothetical protein